MSAAIYFVGRDSDWVRELWAEAWAYQRVRSIDLKFLYAVHPQYIHSNTK